MAEHIGNTLVHILANAKEEETSPLAQREGMARTILQFGIDERGMDVNDAAAASAAYDTGEKLCESPIERVTLAGMLTHKWQVPSGPPALHDPTADLMLDVQRDGMTIVPQAQVLRYRLDFALVAEWDGAQHTIAVECDGADYHRGIKDSERDLYLASWGIPCFRLSGRAITSNVHTAIDPIRSMILDWRLAKVRDLRLAAVDLARGRLGWL